MKNNIKPLRTVILYSSGHLGSSIVFNLLNKSKEIEIVGLIKTAAIPKVRGRNNIMHHIRKIGWKLSLLLSFQRVIQAIGYFFAMIIPGYSKNHIMPSRYVAKKTGIPVFSCKNINDGPSENFLRHLKPDLIVSGYFNQIIKKNIIIIPKFGILNIHPGLLPSYRGAMAYFWMVKNNEERAGVSVHWIDEGVDTGELVAMKTFTMNKETTQHEVLIKTAVFGAYLVRKLARKLLSGKEIKPIAKANVMEKYYSIPKPDDIDGYLKKRRFFKKREIFRTILGKIRKNPR